jgi:hypothetical protein
LDWFIATVGVTLIAGVAVTDDVDVAEGIAVIPGVVGTRVRVGVLGATVALPPGVVVQPAAMIAIARRRPAKKGSIPVLETIEVSMRDPTEKKYGSAFPFSNNGQGFGEYRCIRVTSHLHGPA